MSVTKQNPNSPTSTGRFTFEFPTLISDPALQNDIVFCGKIFINETEEDPFLGRSTSFRKPKAVRSNRREKQWASFQLPETGYSRLHRSGSRRRYANGLFGVVKFPVQMELSDMKKRQSLQLMKLGTATDGKSEKSEKSEWKWLLIRTLRRKGRQWLNALSTSSFDYFR